MDHCNIAIEDRYNIGRPATTSKVKKIHGASFPKILTIIFNYLNLCPEKSSKVCSPAGIEWIFAHSFFWPIYITYLEFRAINTSPLSETSCCRNKKCYMQRNQLLQQRTCNCFRSAPVCEIEMQTGCAPTNTDAAIKWNSFKWLSHIWKRTRAIKWNKNKADRIIWAVQAQKLRSRFIYLLAWKICPNPSQKNPAIWWTFRFLIAINRIVYCYHKW